MPKTYIVGNWKMNQTFTEVESFFEQLKNIKLPQGHFWIAPQFIQIPMALELTKNTQYKVGAQNASENNFGAFTGEVAMESLKEAGCHFVLIGHSERRSLFGETDKVVNQKIKKATGLKLIPILCIGETLYEREANQTMNVVLGQLMQGLQDIKLNSPDELLIAYEPVWAIGTGKTATPTQAEEVHSAIRQKLVELYGELGNKISILYGGSVKPDNVTELLNQPNINGGLVGGASVKADSFAALCKWDQ
jgi:triosephosphate isomerase (TIM)